MKKLNLLPAFALWLLLCSLTPEQKEILIKAHDKCQSVKNGYLEYNIHKKYMSDIDTHRATATCYFKKLDNDSLFSSKFHIRTDYGESKGGNIYTGDEYLWYSVFDSSGKVMSKTLWSGDIKQFGRDGNYYSPLSNRISNPMPDSSNLEDDEMLIKYHGKEEINGKMCHKFSLNVFPEKEEGNPMHNFRYGHKYWIEEGTYIPLQYTTEYDIVMNNDTMYQLDVMSLTKYEVNSLDSEDQFSISAVPEFIKLEDYEPRTAEDIPKLLAAGTVPPDWSYPATDSTMYTLSELKGKVVLVDFFYRSCYGCMLAIPGLQKMHEKYSEKGLVILGVNPFDKNDEQLKKFLDKRGVTYPVLFGNRESARNDYKISAYPTIYLVGRDGKIIHTHVGYSEDSEKELEKIIKENL